MYLCKLMILISDQVSVVVDAIHKVISHIVGVSIYIEMDGWILVANLVAK